MASLIRSGQVVIDALVTVNKRMVLNQSIAKSGRFRLYGWVISIPSKL